MRRPTAATIAGLGAILAVGIGATPAFGQASAGEVEPPPAAEAPLQFEVGPMASVSTWESPAGRPAINDATVFGLSAESIVADYFGIRLDLAYGTHRFLPSAEGGATGFEPSIEAGQYSVDVVLVGRLGLPRLREIGVVPFATIGLGSVVHDPKPEDLATRSQSAWEYGAGVDLPLLTHFGARLEWRRADVSLEDLFDDDGSDRTGLTVSNDRFTLGAYVRF